MTERKQDQDDDDEADGRLLNFKNIGVDGIKFLAAMFFVIWATWMITTERYTIIEEFEAKINQNTEDIRRLDKIDHDVVMKDHVQLRTDTEGRILELNERISNMRSSFNQQNEILSRLNEVVMKLRERQLFVLQNIWTEDDHIAWCKEVQLKNQNWVCPPLERKKSRPFPYGDLNDSIKEDLNRAMTEDPTKLWPQDEPKHPANKK